MQNSFFLILNIYVCIYVCIHHVWVDAFRGQKRVFRTPETGVTSLMWVLGIKLGSSGRAANYLNH